jgi:hypothetical protein
MSRFGAGEEIDTLRPPPLSKRTPGDWKYRTPQQQIDLRAKHKAMRQAQELEAAQAWGDLVEAELGDDPPLTEAEPWWARAAQVERLKLRYGWLARWADDYAEHCRKTAAVIEPNRFGAPSVRQSDPGMVAVPVKDLFGAAMELAALHGIDLAARVVATQPAALAVDKSAGDDSV